MSLSAHPNTARLSLLSASSFSRVKQKSPSLHSLGGRLESGWDFQYISGDECIGRKATLAAETAMADIPLTADQEAQAQSLLEAVQQAVLDEARQMARLLASKEDAHLLGRTEFDLRDHAHRLAARLLESALDGRKKGGTAVPAPPAPSASRTPAARAGATKASSACSGRCACGATTTTAAAAAAASAPSMTPSA